MGWSETDIPDQAGRTAVVTGANSGVGYRTARALARRGAYVLLACRSEPRGRAALARLLAEVPGARAGYRHLDLADLASVRSFAGRYDTGRLDLLINNAGVMAPPYGRTADGFETQFGVNHLGHFALTGLLLPTLRATPGARVVTVSSALHALGTLDLGDLNSEHHYRRWVAYGRSKTANLLFTHQLARLLGAAGCQVVAAAAHPGYADTPLHGAGPRAAGRPLTALLLKTVGSVAAQSPERGALPTLYAATASDVRPGDFIGPRLHGWRGAPTRAWRAPWTVDDTAAERLWSASEQLTGVRFAGLPAD